MGKAVSVIEINGVRYDAGTGKAITKVKNLAKQTLSTSGQVIDGFVRQKSTTIPSSPIKSLKTSKSQVERTKKQPAKNVHQRLEKSHTLVRQAVAKPSLKVRTATKSFTNPIVREGIGAVDHFKELRAKNITKNSKVSRYGSVRPKTFTTPQNGSSAGEVINRKPVAKTENVNTSRSLAGNASHSQLERMLDVALFSATSHRKKSRKNQSSKLGRLLYAPKWLKFTLAGLVISMAVLVFAWIKIPVVAIKVTGIQANIKALAPSYVPAGYSYTGPAEIENSSVKITYQDDNTSSNYVIFQKKSNLNSTAVANSFANPTSQVLSSQVNGKTVYVYGEKNDAAWVSNGILSTISNNAELSSDELLKIAGSMQ